MRPNKWTQISSELRHNREHNQKRLPRPIGEAYLMKGSWWWGGNPFPQGEGIVWLGNGTEMDVSTGAVYREGEAPRSAG